MRILGLDPASTKSGYCVCEDGEPIASQTGVWKPKKADAHQLVRLVEWGDFVRSLLTYGDIDIVCVEECAPQRNAMTFRALVRFEAVASYETKRAGKILIVHRVSEARKIIMGAGNAKKEDVFHAMKDKYPEIAWPAIDKGGDDISDSIAMAQAAPQLAERR